MATRISRRPRTNAEPATEESVVEVSPAVEAESVRRYRALKDFEVEQGEYRLHFHAGRCFSTSTIPFDADLMEPA